MTSISMQAVGKYFDKNEVIKDVNFEISAGEFTVFVGPSGCGKSTLLRLIAGLEEVSSGDIAFDDQRVTDLAPAERGVAMVFQSYALYPHMSVYDNMAFGLKLAKQNKQAISERVHKAARTLQIEHLLNRKPKELSGGQRQRVAIGRAIVRQPRVFLFDEPLSNLDAALRVQTRLELKRLHRDLKTTMIYVTHDQIEAMTLADRIVVLNEGQVEQIGTPLELYHKPCNRFVAGFIGSPKMNFLTATLVAKQSDQVTLDVDGGEVFEMPVHEAFMPQPGDTLTLGVRPERLSVCVSEAAEKEQMGGVQIKGEVIAIEYLGSETYVHLACGGEEPLVFKSVDDHPIDVGQAMSVAVPVDACYLFDREGNTLIGMKNKDLTQ